METTVDVPHPAPGRPHAPRVPWSPRAWGQAVRLAGGIVVQVIPWLLLTLIVAWGTSASHGQWRYRGWLLFVLLLALVTLLLIPALTRVHRHRLRTAGIFIPPQPRRPDQLTPRGIVATLRSQPLWRQVAYHLLAGPLLGIAAAIALALWLGGLLSATVYLYGWGLRPGSVFRRATYPTDGINAQHLGHIPAGVFLTAAGIIALAVAPAVTAAVAELDARVGRSLLGPSRAEELAHRVEHLTQTRAGAVDAADAERRRLERDLHDGTQQRLVSLAMNLGMARTQAATAEQAQQAIADAHDEAKAALAELRDLIRGLHPAVLEDRGLDAALSGVIARTPIPVRLTVDMTRRPAPVVEAVAYFVVSEGLTNIVRHAQASQAEVIVQRAGDRLHVIITDDGVGGADPARGTGLDGLRKRAESVDGTFDISSPPGGPTLLTVDLPCVR
ncbi:sensor histidine kinase [Trebonia kvetii]|uniref:histidine kinase n=1 Tax=Trebonia kvetii TaxID=2480626 RepID=A0A6P2BLY2_9ACTN|nr:histidine kinase [Trebonia kvetii]TVY99951.1 sensor histidine kinase [Trebonia kvetii]